MARGLNSMNNSFNSNSLSPVLSDRSETNSLVTKKVNSRILKNTPFSPSKNPTNLKLAMNKNNN